MIIALAGLPRVGKDTFAKTISKFYNIKTYAFALPFKKALCELFGWKLEDFESDQKDIIDPNLGVSMRQMMEYFGTEIMRKDLCVKFPMFNALIGERIWVKRAEDFIEENEKETIIITDLRHTIEYEMLKKRKATLIKIDRPNYGQLNYSKCYDIPSMKFDYTIQNDYENYIENYERKIKELYDIIRKEN